MTTRILLLDCSDAKIRRFQELTKSKPWLYAAAIAAGDENASRMVYNQIQDHKDTKS